MREIEAIRRREEVLGKGDPMRRDTEKEAREWRNFSCIVLAILSLLIGASMSLILIGGGCR